MKFFSIEDFMPGTKVKVFKPIKHQKDLEFRGHGEKRMFDYYCFYYDVIKSVHDHSDVTNHPDFILGEYGVKLSYDDYASYHHVFPDFTTCVKHNGGLAFLVPEKYWGGHDKLDALTNVLLTAPIPEIEKGYYKILRHPNNIKRHLEWKKKQKDKGPL